jgi:hypothetical protein
MMTRRSGLDHATIKAAISASDQGPARRLSDGFSLYLLAKNGRGYWIGRARARGEKHAQDHVLGTFHEAERIGRNGNAPAELTAASARKAWADRRAALRSGTYIPTMRARTAVSSTGGGPQTRPFGAAVRAYIEAQRKGRGAKWYEEKCALVRDYLGAFEHVPCNAITTQQVAGLLTGQKLKRGGGDLWQGTGASNAGNRVLGLIQRTLSAADLDRNPADWERVKHHVLDTAAPVESHATMPWKLAPELFARIGNSDAERALKIVLLTGLRIGSVLQTDWSEFDFEAREWKIPAEHLKQDQAAKRMHHKFHAVYITDALLEVLGTPGTGRLFADVTNGEVLKALQRFGYRDPDSGKPTVTHGLRACLTSWAEENRWDQAVTDYALAHKPVGNVKQAYFRVTRYDQRAEQSRDWAAFLASK